MSLAEAWRAANSSSKRLDIRLSLSSYAAGRSKTMHVYEDGEGNLGSSGSEILDVVMTWPDRLTLGQVRVSPPAMAA